MIGTGNSCLMTLQFQIIIIPEKILIPADGFFRLFQLVVDNLFRNLPTDTGGTDYQSFMILLQFIAVGTRTHIVSHSPCTGHQLYKIMITFFILRQYNQVITALVGLTLFLVHRAACHIHLTTDNGLEQFIFGFRYFCSASRYLRFLILTFYLTALYAGNPFFQVFYLPSRTAVLLIDIVGEFLDTEHITMIGNGYTFHTILHRLVYQPAYAGLTVKK